LNDNITAPPRTANTFARDRDGVAYCQRRAVGNERARNGYGKEYKIIARGERNVRHGYYRLWTVYAN